MLSIKRLLYIVLIVVTLGGIFLIYSIYQKQPASIRIPSCLAPEREFFETIQVEDGDKPKVWIFGDSEDELYGKIYCNVRQFCEDIHLTVVEERQLETNRLDECELVIFCDSSIGSYADLTELERYIAGGGKVILAAGLPEGDEYSGYLTTFGILEKCETEDYHDLIFENPLLPIQPEQVYYDKSSSSARIEVGTDAAVYLCDADKGTPLVYTYPYQKGSSCLINGTFLTDIRCIGLLSGAISVLLPDFIYPVLGVKAVFLDDLYMADSADDELCRQLYGYSAEGFIRDVVWPAFQGISLRTDTPYTSSILAAADSVESFEAVNDTLFTTIAMPILQFGGELVYAASCTKDSKVVLNDYLIDRFSKIFPSYTVHGLVMETDNFSSEMLNIPGADLQSVRGMLESRDTRLSWKNGLTVFPAATSGNSMEDGTLFDICSVVGAYGLISHVFDINTLITAEGDIAAWDLCKSQLGIFESEVLYSTSWLEGRTLTQTDGDVRSYQNMDYSWEKNGSRIELNCSGAAKGQAFFYHTDSRIADAEGLTYQYVGNGYYLLRAEENHGIITLEGKK